VVAVDEQNVDVADLRVFCLLRVAHDQVDVVTDPCRLNRRRSNSSSRGAQSMLWIGTSGAAQASRKQLPPL